MKYTFYIEFFIFEENWTVFKIKYTQIKTYCFTAYRLVFLQVVVSIRKHFQRKTRPLYVATIRSVAAISGAMHVGMWITPIWTNQEPMEEQFYWVHKIHYLWIPLTQMDDKGLWNWLGFSIHVSMIHYLTDTFIDWILY